MKHPYTELFAVCTTHGFKDANYTAYRRSSFSVSLPFYAAPNPTIHIELFGNENYAFLKQILELKNGIPSHDTINHVFQALTPRTFERCFIQWAQGLKDVNILERVIAIDGKTVRGSKDSFHHRSPIHLVHAWSVKHGICLGQMQCDSKSNEITAIPQILDLLDIKGSIITIDAMGTQREIAKKIVENGGDYILAVKGNQGGLEEEVHSTCNRNRPVYDTTVCEKGHGRIETRRCQVFEKGLIVDFENKWAELKSIIKITATRELAGKIETNERYYINSAMIDTDFNQSIRKHWGVENNLHWVLDMTFREDECRNGTNTPQKTLLLSEKYVSPCSKKMPEKVRSNLNGLELLRIRCI